MTSHRILHPSINFLRRIPSSFSRNFVTNHQRFRSFAILNRRIYENSTTNDGRIHQPIFHILRWVQSNSVRQDDALDSSSQSSTSDSRRHQDDGQWSKIIDAPRIALQNDDEIDKFVDSATVWYSKVKLLSNDHKFPNASLLLGTLNQIDRRSDGRLFAKFNGDWSVIYRLMRSMMNHEEDGSDFERFGVRATIGALAAIRDFANATSGFPIGNRRLLDEWITRFSTYIVNVQPEHEDYCFLERRSANILEMLASLVSTKTIGVRPLKHLCQLATKRFDSSDIGGDDSKNTNNSTPTESAEKSLYYFANAFQLWNCDPESIVEGSWRSWYDLCRSVFQSRLIQFRRDKGSSTGGGDHDFPATRILRLASRAVSIAAEFERHEEFWSIYNLCKRISMELLYRYNSPVFVRSMSDQQLDVARQTLPNFVYNLGVLARFGGKNRTIDQQQATIEGKNRYEHLLPMIDNALSKLGIVDGLSHCRALTGLKYMKFSSSTPDFELSPQYYSMLESWAMRIAAKPRPSPAISRNTASILYLLREMKLRANRDARSRALAALILVFDHNFVAMEKEELNRTLTYFGDACLNFDLDPRRILAAKPSSIDVDIWTRYFERSKYYLESCWPVDVANLGERKKLVYFLSIVADVAYRYDLPREFADLYEIYARRLQSVFRTLTPSQAYFLRRTLSTFQLKGQLDVDEELLVELGMKARKFVPKSKSRSD